MFFCCEDTFGSSKKKAQAPVPTNTQNTFVPPPPNPTPPLPQVNDSQEDQQADEEVSTNQNETTNKTVEPLPVNAFKTPTAAMKKSMYGMTAVDYYKAAIAHGIPNRPNGLFSSDDPHLIELSKDPQAYPFEKHFLNSAGEWEPATTCSLLSGDSAAKHGVDIRLFLKKDKLTALIRLSLSCSIAVGCAVPTHGGCVEAILHECCLELFRITKSPFARSTKFNVQLLDKLPQYETLICTAIVRPSQPGKAGEITATLVNPARGGKSLTTCTLLVNIVSVPPQMKFPTPPAKSTELAGGGRNLQDQPVYGWEKMGYNMNKTVYEILPNVLRANALIQDPHYKGGLLIELDDPLYAKMLSNPELKPFHKLMISNDSGKLERVVDGWINCEKSALTRGMDVRLFWNESKIQVMGVARFGNEAAQGPGTPTHDGALDSILDELTAEFARIHIAPVTLTSGIEILYRGTLPALNETYELIAGVEKVLPGDRYEIFGIIQDTQSPPNVLCKGVAKMADLMAYSRPWYPMDGIDTPKVEVQPFQK